MAWIYGNRYLTEAEMQNNALIVRDYLLERGWSLNAICALLGNMETESTINPAIWQSLKEGNYSGGYGLVQWTPATNYTDWATSNGYAITDGNAQLRWIDEVTTSVGQWIRTDTYNLSFTTFKTSTESVEWLCSAFLYNFERPKSPNVAQRQQDAVKWYNYLSENQSEEPDTPETDQNTEIINDAVDWAVSIANDDVHGYDQTSRWGPDYDCSSLVIQAYENAGCPVKTNGASYTGNMEQAFVATGFESIPYTEGMEIKKGDVLLRSGHTAMYIGDGKIVQANINENGETTGGATGDQTGNEIHVISFTTSAHTWLKVLRLPSTGGGDSPDPPEPPKPKKKKSNYKFVLFHRKGRTQYDKGRIIGQS